MPATKKSPTFLNIIFGVFYLLVFFLLLRNSFGYLDPDYGWHLQVGKEIWQTRAVPVAEHYDYILAGRIWVDHEWLMNLITYVIAHNFGYIALSIFFALLIIAALIIQLQFTRKNFLPDGKGVILVLLLQLFGIYACLPHLGVRMQEISIFCLLLLCLIVYYYNKNKNYRLLFWLLPLFLFWASAHAGFLIGFFILGMFVAVKAVELLSYKKYPQNFIDYEKVLHWRQIGIVVVFSLLSFIVTMLTPYGFRLYEFLADYRGAFLQTHISEWQGAYCFPFQYPQLLNLEIALLFLILLLLAVFLLKSACRWKINLWNFLLVAVFIFLSLKARRHFPLFFIVSLPIMAGFFAEFFCAKIKLPEKWGKKKQTAVKAGKILAIPAMLLAIIWLVHQTGFTATPESKYKNDYPYEAIKFLREHPEWNERNIFNEYGWGGYLIWQYPERKLFIDGRLPQLKFKSHSLLEEYFEFSDREKISAKLEEHDICLALLRIKEEPVKIHWWEDFFFGINKEKILKAREEGFALRDYLRASSEWRSVYNDGLAEIFTKRF